MNLKPGQWVLFDIGDKVKQAGLAKNGAWCSPDSGSLVAVTSGCLCNFILVDKDGNNFIISLASGPGAVFYKTTSPAITNLRQLTKLSDLPPGRPLSPYWHPAFGFTPLRATQVRGGDGASFECGIRGTLGRQ